MGWKRVAKKVIRGLSIRKVPVEVPVLEGSLLRGRFALVTGGTSGIGFAMARAFLANGAGVVVTGRDAGRLERAVGELRGGLQDASGSVCGVILDSSTGDEGAFARALDESERMLGSPLDVLVNNAGVIAGGQIPGADMEGYDLTLSTNLRGAYFLAQEFAGRLVASGRRGNILNVCSSSSLRPAVSPYTLSKWGLRGLTLGLAKSLAPHGVVVNGLAPGPTATPMLLGDDSGNLDNPAVPVGRYATPEEIANMAVVLVSDLARMVVGDVVYMTGGCGNLTCDDVDYTFAAGAR